MYFQYYFIIVCPLDSMLMFSLLKLRCSDLVIKHEILLTCSGLLFPHKIWDTVTWGRDLFLHRSTGNGRKTDAYYVVRIDRVVLGLGNNAVRREPRRASGAFGPTRVPRQQYRGWAGSGAARSAVLIAPCCFEGHPSIPLSIIGFRVVCPPASAAWQIQCFICFLSSVRGVTYQQFHLSFVYRNGNGFPLFS